MCDGVLSPTSPARYFFFLNHLILKHPKNKNQLNPSYVHKEQNVKKVSYTRNSNTRSTLNNTFDVLKFNEHL